MLKIVVILILLNISCLFGQTQNYVWTETVLGSSMDRNRVAILKYNPALDAELKDYSPITLNPNSFTIIDSLLLKCINKYNPIGLKDWEDFIRRNPDANISEKGFVIDPKRKYLRQYIPLINNQNDTIVWVNFFCEKGYSKEDFELLNWKQNVVYVMDGGSCYFNLKINLTKRIYYELEVNDIGY